MEPSPTTIRVAAVQAAPVFLDRDATVKKAVDLIDRAARDGANLIVFGEGFLPGHPVWFHLLPITHPASIELSTRLVDQAVTIPGPEIEALGAAALRARAVVVVGVIERPDPAASVLFDSVVVLGPDGELVGRRRKIVPAVGERIVFTAGGGQDIRTFETPWGPLSVLLGGENANPLLTAALRGMGARLHVACWPPHFNKPGLMSELMTITGRAVAYQNTAWVTAVAGASSPEAIERLATTAEQRTLLEATTRDAASVVFAPRGARHAGPLAGGDGILVTDLDLGAGVWANLVNRHYDRPDLLRLTVDRRSRLAGGTLDDAPAGSVTGSAETVRQALIEQFGDRLSAVEIDELVARILTGVTPDDAAAGGGARR
ncbi:MAG: nitrilase-related carbon-nitrogen hydrolase [Solirubrobacterales bacterium]